jgi:MoaA/NifB/PqqE/SkfB family radical SAM enzyme
MPLRYGWRRTIGTAARHVALRAAGYPTAVNLEVTRRCNARCDFCRYPQVRKDPRLDDYLPVVERLKPTLLTLSGGEPLIRQDLESIIARLRAGCPNLHIGLVTNGSLLTVERGLSLWRAGLDHLAVSLDFLDARHDAARGLPGLARHIMTVVPQLVAAGIDRIALETVVKAENLDEVPKIVDWAERHHVHVALSAYTQAKAGNGAHSVGAQDAGRLRSLVDWLVAHKRRSGTILSSTYYLERIPQSFDGGVPGCTAGRRFVAVRPDGVVQPCHEYQACCPYSAWTRGTFETPKCTACWCSCRGESEAPLDWERLKLAASAYWVDRPWAQRPPADLTPTSSVLDLPVDAA